MRIYTKHLVYLLDFKSNAFRELLLSPQHYFVGQKVHINIKRGGGNPLPTKASLSALGTRGSNNSIKIRCTSNWNTLVPKQLSSFQTSCVWFGVGIKICSISQWSSQMCGLFLSKSKLIFQGALKQVCMKLSEQFLSIIIKGLFFFCQISYSGGVYVVLRVLVSYLSLMWQIHICICWLSRYDFEQHFLVVSIDQLTTELNCSD